MGLYIVPAGDDKPPQGNGRRPKEMALLQTGMFNPIKHFLVPLCRCLCSLAWHHLLWPMAECDRRGSGQGLEHFSVTPVGQDKSRVLEMFVRRQDGSDGWLGPPLCLFAGINNPFATTVLCPALHSRCWCWGTRASKGQSNCCHQQFIKLQTAPRENLQPHLKRNGLFKLPLGLLGNSLGFISVR